LCEYRAGDLLPFRRQRLDHPLLVPAQLAAQVIALKGLNVVRILSGQPQALRDESHEHAGLAPLALLDEGTAFDLVSRAGLLSKDVSFNAASLQDWIGMGTLAERMAVDMATQAILDQEWERVLAAHLDWGQTWHGDLPADVFFGMWASMAHEVKSLVVKV
jgi:hypothetical protein